MTCPIGNTWEAGGYLWKWSRGDANLEVIYKEGLSKEWNLNELSTGENMRTDEQGASI